MNILRKISAAILAVMLAASTSIIGFAASSLDEAKSVAEKYAYAIQTRNGSAAYDCIMHVEDYPKPLNVNQKRQISLDGMKQLVVNGKFTEFEILSVVGDSQQATVIVRTTSHGEDEQAELHLKKIGNRYKVDKLFRDPSRKVSESGHASAKTNQSSEKNSPETRGSSITYSFLCDPGDTSSLEGIRVASLRKGKYFRIAGNQQYAVGKDDGNLSVIYEIFQNAWDNDDQLRFTLTMSGTGEFDYSTSDVSFRVPESADYYVSVTNDSPYKSIQGDGKLSQSST